MMQHAGDKLLWGKGIYFAEKAAYSNVDKYVYQVRFFYARSTMDRYRLIPTQLSMAHPNTFLFLWLRS